MNSTLIGVRVGARLGAGGGTIEEGASEGAGVDTAPTTMKVDTGKYHV